MSIQSILAFLAPFEGLLKPEAMKLEAQGKAELDALIAGVASPELKMLLQAVSGGLDAIAQYEIAKLG